MDNNCINLARVPRALSELVGGRAPVPTYRTIYARVLDGSIPAEQRNGRWYMHQRDVDTLAADLRSRRVRF